MGGVEVRDGGGGGMLFQPATRFTLYMIIWWKIHTEVVLQIVTKKVILSEILTNFFSRAISRGTLPQNSSNLSHGLREATL